jgi:hypothetical protein
MVFLLLVVVFLQPTFYHGPSLFAEPFGHYPS